MRLPGSCVRILTSLNFITKPLTSNLPGWPVSPELLENPDLERAFAELSQKDPSSLLVDVASNDDKELLAGLTAPVCEIVGFTNPHVFSPSRLMAANFTRSQ